MRTIILLSVACMVSTACTPSRAKEVALAECQLSALGHDGSKFRQNISGEDYLPSGRDHSPTGYDGAFRDYLLICMQSKGYQFAAPKSDPELDSCWVKATGGLSGQQSFASTPNCYRRIW